MFQVIYESHWIKKLTKLAEKNESQKKCEHTSVIKEQISLMYI